MSLLELFCAVDDFWQAFAPQWQEKLLTNGQQQRIRARDLSESELMTIVIHFHQARYRDFKTYYTEYVQVYLRREFPKLLSYGRFVQLLPSILEPLCVFLQTCYCVLSEQIGHEQQLAERYFSLILPHCFANESG